MDKTLLAYLAGAMDSDGCFSIKKSTYHLRVRKDSVNAIYSERIGLKQVTPEIPHLLQETFGGGLAIKKGGTANSKPLWSYDATDLVAARACRALLPFVRVKRKQCEAVIELGDWRRHPDAKKASFWWLRDNPNWKRGVLINATQAAELLHHKTNSMVSQAIRNGTLVALPEDRSKGTAALRYPLGLVQAVAANQGKNGHPLTPPPLIEKYVELHERVRCLNQIGLNGTPLNHRTGYYTPA